MSGPIRDTAAMIAGMAPVLDEQVYQFCTVTDRALLMQAMPMALARFDEDEGVSLILSVADAAGLGFETDLPMRRITLSVQSALDGVGLTAAVATALAGAGIACNMVAAYHHDHVFVPADTASRAMDILYALASDQG